MVSDFISLQKKQTFLFYKSRLLRIGLNRRNYEGLNRNSYKGTYYLEGKKYWYLHPSYIDIFDIFQNL